MDETARHRAQAAADAAGLPLAAWLDRAILENADSYVPPPAWAESEDAPNESDAEGHDPEAGDSLSDPAIDPETQAALQQALEALEARLEARESNVTQFVLPLGAKLDKLSEDAAMMPASTPGNAPANPAAALPATPQMRAYRRGLGLIAATLLLLSFGGAGGIVWLWFEMSEPPPPKYADIDASEFRQALSPGARAAMRAPGAEPTDQPAPTADTESAAPALTPGGAPAEFADLEALIEQSRVGKLAAAMGERENGQAADSAPAAPPGEGVAAQPAAAPALQPQIAQASAMPPAPGAAAPNMPAGASSPAGGDAQLLAQLRAMVAKNDPKAQHDLGLLMMEGRVLPKDEKAAGDLFEKAAKQGLANAQYNLGVLYDHGIGRPADQTLAYFWYSAAADQGHVPAQYNLGVAAAQGRGMARDYNVAALWFERAARGGLPDAQYNLAQLYENGLGVPQDPDMAYDLYARAAAQGYMPARTRLIGLEGKLGARPSLPPQQPANVPTAKPRAPAAPALARKDILEIQILLRKLALMQSTADGNVGPATRNAIREYQKIAGLPTDGEPSLDLLHELREVAGAQ